MVKRDIFASILGAILILGGVAGVFAYAPKVLTPKPEPRYLFFSSPHVFNNKVWYTCYTNLVGVDVRTGQQTCQFTIPFADGITPKFRGDTLFMGTTSGEVIAIDIVTGKTKWSFHTLSCDYPADPAVSGSVVYVTGRAKNPFVYALDGKTGKKLQTFEFANKDDQYPDEIAAGDSGIIAVSIPNYIAVIDMEKGKELYRVKHPDFANGLTIANGCLYYVRSISDSVAGDICCVDLKTGQSKWSAAVNTLVGEIPTVADDTVFYEDDNGHCLALNAADGKKRWSYDVDASISTSFYPVLSGKFVCVFARDGAVTCLDKENGHHMWTTKTGIIPYTPAVSADTVYVGSDEGYLESIDLRSGEAGWRCQTPAASENDD